MENARKQVSLPAAPSCENKFRSSEFRIRVIRGYALRLPRFYSRGLAPAKGQAAPLRFGHNYVRSLITSAIALLGNAGRRINLKVRSRASPPKREHRPDSGSSNVRRQRGDRLAMVGHRDGLRLRHPHPATRLGMQLLDRNPLHANQGVTGYTLVKTGVRLEYMHQAVERKICP